MNFTKTLFQSLSLLLFLGLAACDWSDSGDSVDILVPRTVEDSLYTTTSSGLKYYDFEAGEGDIIAEDEDFAEVTYVLWTFPEKLFVEGPGSFGFVLGNRGPGGAILGFDEGIHGMKKNTERQIIVPSNLAYDTGDLLFEVIVTEIDTTGRGQ